ncbi:hypothetical protein Tco_1244029 [Tanacetum coccineum]
MPMNHELSITEVTLPDPYSDATQFGGVTDWYQSQWVSDDEPETPEEAPQSPRQAPPSSDYVPGPEHPPSPDYVHGPEYPEYLVPSDDEAPIEDQPLPTDASPTALSPCYVADSDQEEDPKEDPEENPAEYRADEGDDDDNEEEEEDEEGEEHLASSDSTLPSIDPVPSAEDTEHLRQTSLHPHHHHLDFAGLGYLSDFRHLWQHPWRHALLTASPSTHHPSEIPLPPLLLPSTTRRDDLLEADMSLRKRARFTAPTGRFEVGESSATVAARQPRLDVTHATDYSFVDTVDATPRHPMSREVGYRITDVGDDMVRDMEETAPTTLKAVCQTPPRRKREA